MLKRDILGELAAWKNRPHHPLVLKGLRQVGKTFTAKKFGNEFYENVVYLDLRANKSVHRAFEGDFDIDRMVLSISAAEPSARFVPGRTLIIMDEIQDCPNARSSLKYWDMDGRFDVLCTGSFLGVKGFIFEEDGKVVIVECKSSNNRATSMKFVLANPKRYGEHPAMKIADANMGQGKGFDSYPLYSLAFMQEDNGPGIVEMPDVKKLKLPGEDEA
ncbi:MAG: AAA family ATPase [Treponema sp.]|nr:AAA family ATPase [Treponema sp.]